MEVKIEEKFETLKISKICKKELKKAYILAISAVILFYTFLIYQIPAIYPIILLIGSPFAWIIFNLICEPNMYEVIYIYDEKIRFSSSYTEKNAETAMTSFFLIKNLKEIYVREYYEKQQKTFFKKNKLKNIPHYKAHFTFCGEEDYACWGYEVPINEAEKVVRRINNFLEKQKIYNYSRFKR